MSVKDLREGKDPYAIVIELEEKIKELQLCINENASRSQRIIFNLESKIYKLAKENEYLKRKTNGRV